MGSVSSGPNSSWEALLKYVQWHGYYVYCTRMSWLPKNLIKRLLNQSSKEMQLKCATRFAI
jgi:hypothetical protein